MCTLNSNCIIEVRHHFLREFVLRAKLDIVHIEPGQQRAYFLTKATLHIGIPLPPEFSDEFVIRFGKKFVIHHVVF